MSSHTKGPWKLYSAPLRPGMAEIVEVLTLRDVAIVTWSGFDSAPQSMATKKANARIMAAAPELLEALKALCDSLRLRQGSKLIHFNHDELMELIPKGRAAIAKAEGQ